MLPSLSGVSDPEENKNAIRTTAANAPIEINAFLSFFPSDAKLPNEKTKCEYNRDRQNQQCQSYHG